MRAILILTPVLTLWAILHLMARGSLTASVEATNRLFALALFVTYAGLWSMLIAVSRTPRRTFIRAIAATLTAAAILAILEVPAFLRLVHWDVILRRATGEGMDYTTAYVYDVDLSFRRIPRLAWSARPASDVEQQFGLPRTAQERITFTYDRWGYRNATEMNHADVVLIGDSYVEGWYVSDNQTVAAQLAARLGRPVANLGVAGYGSLQELLVLRTDALKRQPRAVGWFFFEGNDLYDDQRFENSRLAPPPTATETVPHREGLAAKHGWKKRSFVTNALRRLRRWSHPLVPNRAPYWALIRDSTGATSKIYFADYAAVPWTRFEEERWLATRAAFEQGWSLLKTRGIQLVFVYVPIKFRVYRDVIGIPPSSPLRDWRAWSELPERFRSFCTAVSATCLDLTPAFQDAAKNGVMVYARTDTHWSRSATRWPRLSWRMCFVLRDPRMTCRNSGIVQPGFSLWSTSAVRTARVP